MLKEISCRCGESKKRFHLNLDFYIDECCEKAGFDHLGRNKNLPEGEKVSEADLVPEVVVAAAVEKKPLRPGEWRLKMMSVDHLKKMVQEKGLTPKVDATKAELINLILPLP